MKQCKKCGAMCQDFELYCTICKNKFGLVEDVVYDIQIEKENKDDNKKGNAEQSLISKYAKFINADVLYKTALCKQNGVVGETENHIEIQRLLEEAAFKGNCDAMFELAEFILQNKSDDEKIAHTWLGIAADAGHQSSKIKLTMLGIENKVKLKNISNESSNNASHLSELIRNAMPYAVSICSMFNSSNNLGAGVLIEGGYVVTNAHVIGKKPKCITARFDSSIDEKIYNLLPVAVEQDYDIAILRFTGLADKKFSAQNNLSLRVSRAQTGEDVYTIGNPLGLEFSVSHGIVSCPSRKTTYPKKVEEVIQADFTANHGNSGGALLDRDNNVLGLITFVPQKSNGGISMCVPSSYIVEVLNNL